MIQLQTLSWHAALHAVHELDHGNERGMCPHVKQLVAVHQHAAAPLSNKCGAGLETLADKCHCCAGTLMSFVFPAGVPGISQLLASSVWQHVTQPLLLKPLMQPGAATAVAAAAAPLQQQTQLRAGVAAGSSSRGSSSGLGSAAGFKAGSPTNHRGSAWGSQGPPGSWQAGEQQRDAVQQLYRLGYAHAD